MGSFKASIGNTQARMTDFLDDLRKCNPLGGGGYGSMLPRKIFFRFQFPKDPFLSFWVIQTRYLLTVQTTFQISTWKVLFFTKNIYEKSDRFP